MKQVHKSSVVPIYGVGATWLVCAVLFGLYEPMHYVACVVMSVAVYLLLKKKFPGKMQTVAESETKPDTGNAELDETILQGRQHLAKIRDLNARIPDGRISDKLDQIENLTHKILARVEKDESKLKQVRQFMNYFLPTTVKLLEQYVELKSQGVKGENIESGIQKIEQLLDTVIVAFQKQLDGLFASQVVDITADIQVMETMMANQGLTKESDF